MDKSLLDFINGCKSSVLVNAMFVKEIMPNGSQHIKVEVEGTLLYDFFYNPNKKKAKDPAKPKTTGGKKPYVIVMTQEVDRLRKEGVKNLVEMTGFLLFLGSNIEWDTGRLIHKRNKKPLTKKDLNTIIPWGRYKIDNMLSSLEEHDLLFNTTEGYFVSRKIIKKGANRNGR